MTIRNSSTPLSPIGCRFVEFLKQTCSLRYALVKIRCSTDKQNESRQLDALNELDIEIDEIIVEKISGKDFNNRTKYQQLKQKLRSGDLVIIHSIDRLSRNYEQIAREWQELINLGVDIKVLDMPVLNTRDNENGLTGKLISDIILKLLSYVAQKEREDIKTRQAEGIKSAKTRGVKFGRPKAKIPSNFNQLYALWKKKELKLDEVLKLLNISRTTFFTYAKTVKI